MKEERGGTITGLHPRIENGRLRVLAEVRAERGTAVQSYLPDREVSALLPRSLLLGEGLSAVPELLQTIEPILVRMGKGRRVRLWEYRGDTYASFLSWRAVRFRGG